MSLGGLRTYDGWGRPRRFPQAEADAYSAEVKAEGRCGATKPTKGGFAGVCVCTREAFDPDDPESCLTEGHLDSRHMVGWDA